MDDKKKRIENDRWIRVFNYDFNERDFFTITTNHFVIKITGGSVIFFDKNTGEKIEQRKGYNYLYTGDVNADETVLFALENGKHFYIFSLEDFTQKLRITLPRTYEAIDVYGSFSEDGETLYIPVQKYVKGAYHFWLCEYKTKDYSLTSMTEIDRDTVTMWP